MAEQNITKRRLNNKQLAILHELYCYRIATSTLLANSLHASNIDDINKRLHRLMKSGYIGRKHEKSYRLIHRPASYYLLPDGVNAIAAHSNDKYSKPVLASIKRMKDPSQRFIRTSLSLYGIRNVLNAALGELINIFSASETAIYDYFPKKRPDLYIQYQEGSTLKQYFLIYVESNKPMYANTRRVKDYSEYISEGEWDITNTPSPALLLVCDRPQLIKRMLSAIYNMDDDVDNELDILIASKEALLTKTKNAPWINIFEPDIVIKPF